MALLRMLGQWLDGSGAVFGDCRSGIAKSFITASHVKQTCYAHTVTAVTLFICFNHCYSQYFNGLADQEEIFSFELWRFQRGLNPISILEHRFRA